MHNPSTPLNLLLLGASGFISGHLARLALAAGHHVWGLTRGQRPLPAGVRPLRAERSDPQEFARALREADQRWDLTIDCICYEPDQMRANLEVLPELTRQLTFLSTDYVFDPRFRRFPQNEGNSHYLREGYGGKKRQCELELLGSRLESMEWTIVRACHVYGPGSLLGPFPQHGRDPELLERLRHGEPLRLVGAGHFLQQPIYVEDLAQLLLSTGRQPRAWGRIFHAAGPEILAARDFYVQVAEILGVDCRIEEVPVEAFLAAHPDQAVGVCHRLFDLAPLAQAGLHVPATPFSDGLAAHVHSLLAEEQQSLAGAD
jgi:nucleoside-diphosphate-sugar epimerase